jgi:hypothetical protein
LEEIFTFSVEDARESQGIHFFLKSVLSVCSQWRRVATSIPKFWRSFPPIRLSKNMPSDHHFKMMNLVNLHIIHSKDSPITFSLSIAENLPSSDRRVVKMMISLLVVHCERWQEVKLETQMSFLSTLDPIRFKLPQLRSIEWTLITIDPPENRQVYHFNLLSFVPKLRHATFSLKNGPIHVFVNLPWHNLEMIITNKADNIFLWHFFLMSMMKTGRWMDCPLVELTCNAFSDHASYHLLKVPAKIPKLKRLHLHFKQPDPVPFPVHFSLFTLPHLEYLEIRGGLHTLHSTVLTMLQRSDCSLKRLALAGEDHHTEAFFQILHHCHQLEDLDIKNPLSNEDLDRLILRDEDNLSLLPELRTLALTIVNPDDEKVRLVDDIIRSRTTQDNLTAYTTSCHPRGLQRAFVFSSDHDFGVARLGYRFLTYNLDADERARLFNFGTKLTQWKHASWPTRTAIKHWRTSRFFYLWVAQAIYRALREIAKVKVSDRIDCMGLYVRFHCFYSVAEIKLKMDKYQNSGILTELSKFVDGPQSPFHMNGRLIARLRLRARVLLEKEWKPAFLEHLARDPWSYWDYQESYWEMNANACKAKPSFLS